MDSLVARFGQRQVLHMRWIVIFILAALCLAGCSSAATAPPQIVDTWQPPAELEATAPISCEENLSLFDYDAEVPLDIQEQN